jgi:mannose-6-phosphate isomerase
MTSIPSVFLLQPTIQSYDWGKRGSESKVAELASNVAGFKLDERTPYAELWMGTHPSSPSRVLSSASKETLSEYLAAHPELLGDRVIDRFQISNGNLPFLFKILSIEKALSIQSHPDKKTAEKLHIDHPDIYKDPNHKPEMALALTPFTGLCGFLPLNQIATHLTSTPEFAALIPDIVSEQFCSIASSTPDGPHAKAALKDVFSALMTADESYVKDELNKLTRRFMDGDAKDTEKNIRDLVLRLYEQFPGDRGIFCSFMLNYVKLQPGEAIFLGAGEPHAYVSGDIVECMANSDNVIRAGLTPKLRDIPNLVSGLTYVASPPSKHAVQPVPFHMPSTATLLYDPPVAEFSVLRVKVESGKVEVHSGIEGPSIAIVTDGEGAVSWGYGQNLLHVMKGSVFFIAAGADIKVVAGEQMHNSLTLFRAFVQVK